jgi:phosphoribosylformylglycinamidine cyclo-ligase
VVPEELSVTVDRSTWAPAPIFDVVRRAGAVSQDDLEATLNCGVGMVALVPPDDVDRALATLDRFGVHAWAAGEVAVDDRRGGEVLLSGRYPGW